MRSPAPGFEAAIVRLYGGMADYAEAHSKRYESAVVTDDYVIGDAWERLGNALHDLLNGETGRLDCATLSGDIYRLIEGGGSQSGIAAVREQTSPPKVEKTSSTIGIGRSALSDRQRQLLAHIRVESNFAVYTSNDRIPDWPVLKTIMVALGGTWKTGGKKAPGGFRFPDDLDAAELVRLAKETGEITDPKAAELFETPLALGSVAVERLEVQAGMRVLEPSAGRGALVRALVTAQHRLHIEAMEAVDENIAGKLGALIHGGGGLRLTGVFNVVHGDFMLAEPGRTWREPFDRVLMNPPFSKRQDIRHVRHAYNFLAPGGVLVAIMSAGVKYRGDKPGREFREFVTANQGEIWDNPPNSFAESGTGVSTVMVRVRRAR
jgi:hypothetical protein